jgi:apolipoprotein N-acyltransferase
MSQGMSFIQNRWLSHGLSVLSGATLVFAFPRWNQEWVVWLWLLPLLVVIWGAKEVRRPFWPGYLAGLGFFIPNLAWVRHSSRVMAGAVDHSWLGMGPELMGFGALIGLSGYCALYFGLWSWFAHRYARPDLKKLTQGTWQESTWESLRCALLAAGAWVACEWLRSTTVFTGFGWNSLGVGLHQNRVLIQVADLVGVMGLSFLPVLVVCTAWNALRRMSHLYHGTGTCRTRLDFTLAMVVLLSAAGYGVMRITAKSADSVTVRTLLVQPNVSQVDAWSGRFAPQVYERLAKFTRLYAESRVANSGMDLVIWPESALPVHLHGQPERWGLPKHETYFDDLLKAGDFSLITGTELYDSSEHGPGGHNSAVLFRGRYENRQEYHKVHLVPFGEYLPFGDYPPFSLLRGVIPGDFEPGKSTEPLHLEKPDVGIIPLICFEDTVGRLARRFVRPGPQMIVNITNDGWFLQSNEMEVHTANAKFRAIELRRPMVRATNTGVTCFIDTLGTITHRLADPETGSTLLEGCLPGEVKVPSTGEMTLYARHGDWFALLCLAACAVLIALRRLRRRSCQP